MSQLSDAQILQITVHKIWRSGKWENSLKIQHIWHLATAPCHTFLESSFQSKICLADIVPLS